MRILRRVCCTSAAGLTFLGLIGVLSGGTARAEEQSYAPHPDSDRLEEVVVTARKREESLQNTPIAISAYTAADIEARQLTNLSQISASTPSLVIAPAPQVGNPNAYSVFLRGVGQLDFTLFTDPGVGIYIDGVYIARSIGSMLDFVDIQRIEVLRGPQGTLFGRNTIGGAINVVTALPSSKLGGNATLTAGSFDRKQFQGTANVPLSDTLSAKVSGYAIDRRGYVERIETGQDVGNDHALAGRAELLWQPLSKFTAYLAVDATRRREQPGALVLLSAAGFGFSTSGARFTTPQTNPATAFNRRLGGACLTNPDSSRTCYGQSWATGNPFTTNDTYGSENDLNTEGSNLTLSWAADQLAIKSITAYRSMSSASVRDTDHTPFTLFQLSFLDKQNQFSQELQLTGAQLDERLKWLLGFYYFRENGTERYDNLNATSFDGVANILAINTNYAVFTENTFDVTKQLHLTAGLRWTHEEKQFRIYYPVTQDFNLAAPPALGALLVGDNSLKKQTFRKATPRATISYDLASDLMTYATYSEGFKSGGFNGRYTAPVPAPITFAPEYIKEYELGVKYQASRVRFNLAAFHSDYSNIQISYRPDPAQILTVIGNAAAGKVDGLEAESTLVPVSNLRIEAGISYLNARYTQVSPGLLPAGVTLSTPFVDTPKFSGNLSGQYNISLGASGNLIPRVDFSYRTRVALDNTNSLPIRQGAYGLLNASVGWSDNQDLWRVAVGGTNLTDRIYLVSGAFNGAAGVADGTYGRPREWYLTVRRSF
jgi:iron complex outermembrane receptor protein